MKRIITLITFACLFLGLTSCSQSSWLYHVNIQQGNVITPDLVSQIRVGMPKEAVATLLGPPILVDAFNENRWTYTYTYKSGKGKFVERNLIIYFRNECVSTVRTRNI